MPYANRILSKWYGKVPIAITLTTAIGLLVLVTVGTVFGAGVWLARKNTLDLLGTNAHQTIAANVSQIELYLKPAEHQLRFLATQIGSGIVDSTNRTSLGQLLIGALAAAPQVEAVIFIDANLQSYGAGRRSQHELAGLKAVDESNNPDTRKLLEDVLRGPAWGPPVWNEARKKTYISRSHPVNLDGQFIGALLAVVPIEQLSDFNAVEGSDNTLNRFILYGHDYVLAHWLLAGGYPDRSAEHPLPQLANFSDPVLSSIWQEDTRRALTLDLPEGTGGHRLNVFTHRYVFVYRTLQGFGPESMIVGSYFEAGDVFKEIRRLFLALLAGFAALLFSLIAAVVLGRRIARPIVQFSNAASSVRRLDVSKVDELPGSVFRELNDQSIAFNGMISALRWFERYVPKKIVEQLIRHGDHQDTISDSREITVMFTDVAGFSTISEGMSATEVAAFVNHHFSLVVGCIEAEQGTVDKFMGDAVMAFWDAPANQRGGNAELACRAALAIDLAIREDNRRRKCNDLQPVGIRIGVHSGNATVGNIGAPDRLNYTVIGDTVNIAQRLEQLGKQVFTHGEEVSILISGDTVTKLPSGFNAVPMGNFTLKGRRGMSEVYSLVPNFERR